MGCTWPHHSEPRNEAEGKRDKGRQPIPECLLSMKGTREETEGTPGRGAEGQRGGESVFCLVHLLTLYDERDVSLWKG